MSASVAGNAPAIDRVGKERILILDFGSQYTQLIARRVRELRVYCEIHPHSISFEKVAEYNPAAIILSGGPASVYDDDAPGCDERIFQMSVPIPEHSR